MLLTTRRLNTTIRSIISTITCAVGYRPLQTACQCSNGTAEAHETWCVFSKLLHNNVRVRNAVAPNLGRRQTRIAASLPLVPIWHRRQPRPLSVHWPGATGIALPAGAIRCRQVWPKLDYDGKQTVLCSVARLSCSGTQHAVSSKGWFRPSGGIRASLAMPRCAPT